ncbi:MAG: hypothetical protein M5U28_36465 [Sandaracinaceae bacterium]|nr:hypothetical protein [Sandaracinaceae bacterium]
MSLPSASYSKVVTVPSRAVDVVIRVPPPGVRIHCLVEPPLHAQLPLRAPSAEKSAVLPGNDTYSWQVNGRQ